jgi:hypothetical protein
MLRLTLRLDQSGYTEVSNSETAACHINMTLRFNKAKAALIKCHAILRLAIISHNKSHGYDIRV